jgi:predicted secreted protein
MKSPICRLLFAALAAAALHAQAGPAHQHGVARLDVAVEANRVTLYLDTPLDNLLGFERAPRTDAERQQADAAVARLKDADKLFRIDGNAGCKLAKVTLTSPALGLPVPASGAPAVPVAKDEHADLEGRFEFSCTAGVRAGFVEVYLFDAFAQMKRIELQLVSPKGQMKATLARPASRVALVR